MLEGSKPRSDAHGVSQLRWDLSDGVRTLGHIDDEEVASGEVKDCFT
ncbi:MAG: hypothetical protein ACYSVY_28280 [Planctomycetota bacterium]